MIGVYRKVSDEMSMVRVRAFLRIIREHEAKGFAEPYHALKWEGRKQITFSDLSTHPYASSKEDKPAGAYQIKYATWNLVLKQTGWPKTFDPNMQDRVAIYLLQERPLEKMPHPRRTALGYILEGDVEKAVNETKLWELFAFLPGGEKQQQISMEKLSADFDKYTKEYSK